MGIFGKLFEKKICDFCGCEIGLLGNRKLEDGNMCKNCASKLSPWFSDRRSSTVAEIKEQLAYREANKKEVASFHTTRSFGTDTKVLIDEDAKKFMVTGERNIIEANPDVLSFSQVTGCDLNIDENCDEARHEDSDGNSVSYNPPRFTYSYSFEMVIRVNHPYFDTIRFDLSQSDVEINPDNPVTATNAPNPEENRDYRKYEEMGKEIKEIILRSRQEVRDAAVPKKPVKCANCGAITVPDENGCCKFCGSPL